MLQEDLNRLLVIEQDIETYTSNLVKISAPDHLTNANHLDHTVTMESLKNAEDANEKIPDLLDEKALILMRIKKIN